MDGVALLSGSHPVHFPVYWEQAEWLTDDILNPGSWQSTPLENELLRRWRSLHESPKPIFKYLIGSAQEPLETKLIPGPLGFLVQRALGRASKRKPPSVVRNVAAPREQNAFNFGQVRRNEIIFSWSAAIRGIPPETILEEVATDDANATIHALDHTGHAVLVNVAPFCSFHFLLVPEISQLLPQVLTVQALRVALDFVSSFSRFLCLLFNSQGAGASVNHLHWQGIYLRLPLPIERHARQLLTHGNTEPVQVERLVDWPITTWFLASSEPDVLVSVAFPVIQALLDQNIAHNLLLRHEENSFKLFIMPRQLASFPDPTQVQIAATEAFGWWIHPDPYQYDNFTEQEARERMSGVALDIHASNMVEEVLFEHLLAAVGSQFGRIDL